MLESVPITLPGSLIRFVDFPSRHINTRTFDIWFPDSTEEIAEKQYSVLYMHDGQNLFDPKIAMGGITWGVAEAITRLRSLDRLCDVMVVGIWSSGAERWRDFMPQKPLETDTGNQLLKLFTSLQGGPPQSDSYLKFMVDELKPWIDSNIPTYTDQRHTYVMGSSMGGLISLYAIEQYPHIFSGAGCLSTHWIAGGDLLVKYLGQHLPSPSDHRLYFDFGTENLDAQYGPYQNRMDQSLIAAGYELGTNWKTLKFDGADHNEASWNARIDIPLTFLFGI
jgi:predicted alpha/beta superfamily hydrolase